MCIRDRLSYARENGILSPTLFSSEVALIAGGLRIGTEHMYSILAVGAGHVANSEAWAAGLGLGGRFTPTESIYLDLDSIMWSARVGDDLENENLIVTTRLLFGYRFSEAFKVSVLMGNILNEEYSVRPGLLEGPRNLTARVDWKF